MSITILGVFFFASVDFFAPAVVDFFADVGFLAAGLAAAFLAGAEWEKEREDSD